MRRQFKDDALVDRIVADYEAAGLDARRLAMCRYADKLTRDPGSMVPEDLGPLRAAGLSDTDILEVCEVISYYAFANRIVDGLGVLSEVDEPSSANSWVEKANLAQTQNKTGTG